MTKDISKEVAARQAIERRIALAVVEAALHAGYLISVDNGEDETLRSAHKSAILNAMFLTDEDRLYIWNGTERLGWVYLVYGNDGWDVINDYTTNLDDLHIMDEANRLSDKYQEQDNG